MKNILFHSGEFWFNLKGFTENPGYPCLDCKTMDCPAKECTEKYEEALRLDLADAVKFEDQEAIRIAICESQPNKGPDYYQFEPVEGQTFFVEGITVKEWNEPLVSQFDIQAGKVPIGTAISEKRKVAVLSNSPVKSEEEENCNAFTDFTAEPINSTMSIEEIIKDLQQLEIGLIETITKLSPARNKLTKVRKAIAALLNRAPLVEETKEEMSPRVAKLIIGIRDALALANEEEAYDLLYQIPSPKFDKTTEIWKDIEAISHRSNVGKD